MCVFPVDVELFGDAPVEVLLEGLGVDLVLEGEVFDEDLSIRFILIVEFQDGKVFP